MDVTLVCPQVFSSCDLHTREHKFYTQCKQGLKGLTESEFVGGFPIVLILNDNEHQATATSAAPSCTYSCFFKT
jgi:hypothetical protein